MKFTTRERGLTKASVSITSIPYYGLIHGDHMQGLQHLDKNHERLRRWKNHHNRDLRQMDRIQD